MAEELDKKDEGQVDGQKVDGGATEQKGSGADDKGTGTKEPDKSQTQTQDKQSYSLDEVKDMLQKESDRRVNDALKKAKKDFETEQAEKERLAKLSSEERERELISKAKADLEVKEREIAEKQLKLDTMDLLKVMELPLSFGEFVMQKDLATTKERAEQLKTLFNDEVQKAVKDAKDSLLKGRTPENLGEDKKGSHRMPTSYDQEAQKAEKTGNVLGMLRERFKQERK